MKLRPRGKTEAKADKSKTAAVGKPRLGERLPKKGVYVGVAVLIVLLTATAIFLYQQRESVIFTVGEEEFRESDIQEYMDLAAKFGINRDYALEGIEQAMIFKITAEEYDVTVNDEEIRQALKKDNLEYDQDLIDTDDKWLRLIGERLALEEAIKNKLDQAAKGYSFGFYFGTYATAYPEGSIGEPPEEFGLDAEHFGDEQRIEEDREYARDRAEHFREELANGDMRPDDALEAIMNDERLHYYYTVKEDSFITTRFGHEEDAGVSELTDQQIADFVKSYDGSINEPSEIQVGKRNHSSADDRNGRFEAYYYFVYLTDIDKKWYELENKLNERGVELLL